jgi:type I restriction enzyme M protein
MNEFTGSAASQADFIWKNAEDLGGLQAYGLWQDHFAVYLAAPPECALEPTREAVREAHDAFKDADVELDTILRSTAEYPFYNTSEYSLAPWVAPRRAAIWKTTSPCFRITPALSSRSLSLAIR